MPGPGSRRERGRPSAGQRPEALQGVFPVDAGLERYGLVHMGEEEVHELRIELRSRAVRDEVHGIAHGKGRLVGPFGDQRVEHVGYGDDARLERDALAREAAHVAGAVPALVMEERDVPDHFVDVGALEHALRHEHVALHDLEFLGRVAPGLHEDLARHAHLADVVQRGVEADAAAEDLVLPDLPRQEFRIGTHPLDVQARVLVVDEVDVLERGDHGHGQALDLLLLLSDCRQYLLYPDLSATISARC